MTLYELLDTLDCHTDLSIHNVSRGEYYNDDHERSALDDIDILEPWFNHRVDYIKVKGVNRLYIEIVEKG